MQYVHKRFIVDVRFPECDGDITLTNAYGTEYTVSDVEFRDYVKVQPKKKKYDLSDWEKGYVETGDIVKQTNNDNYIFDPKLASGKPC